MNKHNLIMKGIFALMCFSVFVFAKANTYKNTINPDDTTNVINSGVGGNTSRDLLDRLHKGCLDYKPNLVILMVGTNDVIHGKKFTLDQYKKNLNAIIDTIQQSGSKVLLLTILPFYEPYLLERHSSDFFDSEGPAKKREEVNDIIKQTSRAKDTYLLDVGSIFESGGNVSEDASSLIRNKQNCGRTDGIHPTTDGYRFLALAVSKFIINSHLKSHAIVCFGDSITKGAGSPVNKSYPARLKTFLNN